MALEETQNGSVVTAAAADKEKQPQTATIQPSSSSEKLNAAGLVANGGTDKSGRNNNKQVRNVNLVTVNSKFQ